MANPYADLRALTVRRLPLNGTAVRPPRRWFSRVVLPLMLLGGFAGLIAWSAWDLLLPAKAVTVTPVVTRAAIVQATGVELFKAIGWIEPRPTAIEVPALTEGVIDKLLVLPGQRVEPGQIIAQLIDTDARFALRVAEEECLERGLKVKGAEADVAEAEAQVRSMEVAVRVEKALFEEKVYFSPAKLEQAQAQLRAAEAKVEQAKARLREAHSRVGQSKTAVEIAQLRLDRMAVRSPVAGVVMSLNAVPGRMVGVRNLAAASMDSLVTLYDPLNLQVRVEVPNDKFLLVQPDQPAEIEVDVIPGRRLPGVVLYDSHETDIQRNTVRVKVGIVRRSAAELALVCGLPALVPTNQAVLSAGLAWVRQAQTVLDRLRPGMIAAVRVQAPPSTTPTKEAGGEVLRVYVPQRLIVTEGQQSGVWIVDQAAGRARLRTVTLGTRKQGDWLEIIDGLHASDKLILSGREGLQAGERVRIVGEEAVEVLK